MDTGTYGRRKLIPAQSEYWHGIKHFPGNANELKFDEEFIWFWFSIQILIQWSLQNFSYGPIAVLSWHEQKLQRSSDHMFSWVHIIGPPSHY